jgi:hypothetical protein
MTGNCLRPETDGTCTLLGNQVEEPPVFLDSCAPSHNHLTTSRTNKPTRITLSRVTTFDFTQFTRQARHNHATEDAPSALPLFSTSRIFESFTTSLSLPFLTMSDFSNESPLAAQLQQVVQPKLAEFGWTTGGDDTTLFDYILLMLANDKNETQVAQELSSDLLDLGPENTETQQFAQWLFEQIEVLKRQLGGGDAQNALADDEQMNSALDDGSAQAQDTDMEGADSAQGSV